MPHGSPCLQGVRAKDADGDLWREVSRAGAALYELVLVEQRVYPWKLMAVLSDPAAAGDVAEDWACCPNMFDALSAQHLSAFSSTAGLQSPLGLAELMAIASVVEDNCGSIERGHAAQKRLASVMEQTHMARITRVDAERVIKRFRHQGNTWHGSLRETSSADQDGRSGDFRAQ